MITKLTIRTLCIWMLCTSFVYSTGMEEQVPKKFIAEVTAYTASVEECGKDDGITASGIPIEEGHVASDDLDFGTKLLINGKEYTVTDRFGGNYRNRIDIYMVSRSDAMRFGRQKLEVTILEEKND